MNKFRPRNDYLHAPVVGYNAAAVNVAAETRGELVSLMNESGACYKNRFAFLCDDILKYIIIGSQRIIMHRE